MNRMYLIFTLVLALTGCNCQKQPVESNVAAKASPVQQNNPVLEYEANTRGFFQKISITGKKVTVSSDRDNPDKGTTTTLSDADADELMRLFKKLDLEALPTYEDPTQKRFYDGAAIASFKVTFNGKEYRTVDFDHGFPPAAIEKMVNKITSYGKQD